MQTMTRQAAHFFPIRLKHLAVATVVVPWLTACGANPGSGSALDEPAPSSTSARSDAWLESASSVRVDTRFRYEPARPQIINGQPVVDHRYWSCVDSATVTFPRPMRLATVMGKVFVASTYSAKRAPTLKRVSQDLRQFTFGFGSESLCNDHQQLKRLIISKDIRTVDGQKFATDQESRIPYPAGRDTLPEAPPAQGAAGPSVQVPAAWNRPGTSSGCTAADPTRCLTVTPERLNAAMIAMRTWSETERGQDLYEGTSLKLLPLDYLIKPFTPTNRNRHYGNGDLLYVLRRAAKFTQLLFPDLDAIPVADLSLANGRTPHVDGTLLHPAGSHEAGRDADVAYITTGSGHDPGARWHFERNFWFTYGVLQSTGVDLVITAYKDELQAMAADAHRRGLINNLSVGRFHALMEDHELNHDKHMHISVRNGANASRSRMFSPTDDVYACYLALRPNVAGGTHNYCGGV